MSLYGIQNERDARDLARIIRRERNYGSVERIEPIVQDAGGAGGSAWYYGNSISSYFHQSGGNQSNNSFVVPLGSTAVGHVNVSVNLQTQYGFGQNGFEGSVRLRYRTTSMQPGIYYPVVDWTQGNVLYFGSPVKLNPSEFAVSVHFGFACTNTSLGNPGLYNPFSEDLLLSVDFFDAMQNPVQMFGDARVDRFSWLYTYS